MRSFIGLSVAFAIAFCWVISLVFLLFVDVYQLSPLGILVALLGRTFIQTGLFIVAHDAIHGVVFPCDRRLNHWVGRLAVTLYALLSYQKLSVNHWQHHRYPGQANDPDFHDGSHENIVAWYLKFMKEYLDIRRALIVGCGLGSIFLILHWGFHCSVAALFLFWILPIVLSSMQLFLFGTYLPHRSRPGKSDHHAVSSNYPLILSFITCYHFGYHWEHHEYPSLPWYSLPTARRTHWQKHSIAKDTGKPLIFRLTATSPIVTLLLWVTG
jgi:beta-carotene/zeaxanthin 4-ketolase